MQALTEVTYETKQKERDPSTNANAETFTQANQKEMQCLDTEKIRQ